MTFCQGQTDINDASRVISDDEKKACSDGGVHYVELAIGRDALTVVGNPANPVDCLSLADLYALFSTEAKGFTNWSDANALDKELGGKGDFPDLPLTIVAPGTESGTYGSFIDLADQEHRGRAGQARRHASPRLSVHRGRQRDHPERGGHAGGPRVRRLLVRASRRCRDQGVHDRQRGWLYGAGCGHRERRHLPALAHAVHLPQHGQGGDVPGAQGIRGLLPERRGDQKAVTDVNYIALPTDELAASRTTWQQTESASPSA